jgi:hypothetical protein
MLRISIGFLLVGLSAMLLGLKDGLGVSFEQGRMFLFIFLALSILSFIASLVSGLMDTFDHSPEGYQ